MMKKLKRLFRDWKKTTHHDPSNAIISFELVKVCCILNLEKFIVDGKQQKLEERIGRLFQKTDNSHIFDKEKTHISICCVFDGVFMYPRMIITYLLDNKIQKELQCGDGKLLLPIKK